MPEIKPIETIYNGYRFRSRLEARWAVFFDEAHIEYQYEPEGYVGLWGDWYLPDFYLPQFDIYCEVKPTDEALRKDAWKIIGVVDGQQTPISDAGLLLLGNIPYSPGKHPVFCCLYWDKGVWSTTAAFDIWDDVPELLVDTFRGRQKKKNTSSYSAFCDFHYFDDPGGDLDRCSVGPTYADWTYYGDSFWINCCYKAARQARFEHGETPEVSK